MNKLTIPEKVSLRSELIPGISIKEMGQFLAAVVPGVIAAIIIWFASVGNPLTQLISIACAIFYLPFCYTLVARFDGAPSLLTHITLQIKFYCQQQKFYYKHDKEVLFYASEGKSTDADGTGIH